MSIKRQLLIGVIFGLLIGICVPPITSRIPERSSLLVQVETWVGKVDMETGAIYIEKQP